MRGIGATLVSVSVFGAGSAGVAQDAAPPMEDEVTAATRAVFDAYGVDHDARYYAEDATFTDMSNPTRPIVGRDAIAGFLGAFYGGAFTDAHGTAENLLIQGNLVMLEFVYTGTHTGPLGEIPASGNRVKMHMMSVYRVEDGHIRWARLYYDSASLLGQIGAGQ